MIKLPAGFVYLPDKQILNNYTTYAKIEARLF
jgi:hypothetical protein